MTEGGLNQVDRTTFVQCMTGVGVTKPVAGYGLVDARSFRGFDDNSPYLRFVEMAFLPTSEDGSVGRSILLQHQEGLPDTLRHQNGPCFVSLAEDGDLARFIPLLKMPPFQRTDFGYTKATGIQG